MAERAICGRADEWLILCPDLLCISDQETWAYGEALRKMAVQKQFDNICFSRMRDLLDVPHLNNMREITYVANCTNFRRLLLNKHGRDDLDIDREIAANPDTKLTYLGYKRFLESDLKHIYPRGADRTANDYRRDCKYIAKQMLIRGYVSIMRLGVWAGPGRAWYLGIYLTRCNHQGLCRSSQGSLPAPPAAVDP